MHDMNNRCFHKTSLSFVNVFMQMFFMVVTDQFNIFTCNCITNSVCVFFLLCVTKKNVVKTGSKFKLTETLKSYVPQYY